MKYKLHRALTVLTSTIVGLFVFVILMNAISHPVSFLFSISSAFESYTYTFLIAMGQLGFVVGFAVLFFYIIVWNILGHKILRYIYAKKGLLKK